MVYQEYETENTAEDISKGPYDPHVSEESGSVLRWCYLWSVGGCEREDHSNSDFTAKSDGNETCETPREGWEESKEEAEEGDNVDKDFSANVIWKTLEEWSQW